MDNKAVEGREGVIGGSVMVFIGCWWDDNILYKEIVLLFLKENIQNLQALFLDFVLIFGE